MDQAKFVEDSLSKIGIFFNLITLTLNYNVP